MVVRIAGKRMYLWRAVDHEGVLVQRRRDKRAALRLMRKLLKKQGFTPKLLTTDKLGSYGSAFRHLRLACPHEQGLRKNNRAETPIKRCDDASARCNGSSQLDPPSASSVFMPPSTTHSTFNATSSPDRRCGPSEPKRRRSGKMPSQWHKPDLPLPPLGSSIVAVTRPSPPSSADWHSPIEEFLVVRV
jgi:transposase-like protein